MLQKPSNKNTDKQKDVAKDASSQPVKETDNEKVQPSEEAKLVEAEDDCIDEVDKNKTVVEKMMNAASTPKLSPNCKCMQRKGKFYCYRLVQGRWTKASGVGYPSKEVCEANNCIQ